MSRETQDDVAPDRVHDSAATPAAPRSSCSPRGVVEYLHETRPETRVHLPMRRTGKEGHLRGPKKFRPRSQPELRCKDNV